MFNLIIIVILSIISVVSASIGIIFKMPEFIGVSIGGGVVILLWIIISIIGTFINYGEQQERLEELRGELNKLNQYKKMKDELLIELKNYLGAVYPNQESEIFKSISNSKSDMSIVMSYPEIQSSHVLKELAVRIKDLYYTLYNLQTIIEDKCAKIRYNAVSKWPYTKPVIPEVLFDVIYSNPLSNN